jgi:hypothetical protein
MRLAMKHCSPYYMRASCVLNSGTCFICKYMILLIEVCEISV